MKRIWYKDGTYKDVPTDHAWEYENDPDWDHTEEIASRWSAKVFWCLAFLTALLCSPCARGQTIQPGQPSPPPPHYPFGSPGSMSPWEVKAVEAAPVFPRNPPLPGVTDHSRAVVKVKGETEDRDDLMTLVQRLEAKTAAKKAKPVADPFVPANAAAVAVDIYGRPSPGPGWVLYQGEWWTGAASCATGACSPTTTYYYPSEAAVMPGSYEAAPIRRGIFGGRGGRILGGRRGAASCGSSGG